MVTQLIQHTSKSRYVTRGKCKRKGYYANELGGHGIRVVAKAEYLNIGSVWHEAMERILQGEDYAIVARESGQKIRETLENNAKKIWGDEEANLQWARWMEGMVYAAGKYIIPSILREYEIVSIEKETKYDLPPVEEHGADVATLPIVRLIGRPDLVLRRKLDGTYWYWEWKTTGWMDTRWLRQWDKDIQLQGAAKAIEATQGIKIDGCVVQGVYKGYKKEGVISHPFVYAYGDMGVLGTEAHWQVKWDRKLPKRSTDEFVGGVQAWVDRVWEMDQQTVLDLFPRTLPISINERLVRSYFRQLWLSEQSVWYARNNPDPVAGEEYHLDMWFPQNFWECEPSIGAKCEFFDCCWNREVGEDPIGSGLYEARDPRPEDEVTDAV